MLLKILLTIVIAVICSILLTVFGEWLNKQNLPFKMLEKYINKKFRK